MDETKEKHLGSNPVKLLQFSKEYLPIYTADKAVIVLKLLHCLNI